MKTVEIFSRPGCGYTHRAKYLLAAKNAAFVEFDIWSDPEVFAEMNRRSAGRRTSPQIFVGGVHIGGSDELFALERQGKLDALLAA